MQGSLVFVHGTGVRQEGWVPFWGRVQDYARIAGITGVQFVGCDWWRTMGVPVDLIPETLPPEPVTRSIAGPALSSGQLAAAAWALLLDDPLFELRLAASGGAAPAGGAVVGGLRQDQEAVRLLTQLAGGAGALDLTGMGIAAGEIAAAATAVGAAPELAGAALARGAGDLSLLAAVSRAVVARALAPHREDAPGSGPPALLDGGRRDRLVQAVRNELAKGTTRNIFTDWIKEKATGFILQKGTRLAADRRSGIMGASTPGVGDVLYYQRRGGEILRFLAGKLAGLPRPVVAVGHSLGGIMLVDLLSRPEAPPVDLLVTAGSQAPFLYALDALEGVRRGQAAPAPFTPWLNFYNRQDFLSFCAARVFPNVANVANVSNIPGIRDVEVDPGVPFPESHSAYWYHDKVYAAIRDAWPGDRP
jgi:hypothetical protein